MRYFAPEQGFSEDTRPIYEQNHITFTFANTNHPNETWNVAFVMANMNGDKLTLKYAEKKHHVEIENPSEIQALWAQYPFLKDSKKWESKKGLMGSLMVMAVLAIAAMALIYFVALPWLGAFVASKIPMEYEIKLGKTLYEQSIEGYEVLDEKSVVLNDFIKKINLKTEYPIQITVVKSDQINAFALPGGNIVVFSALLDKMESYPELVALLSHEVSHVHYKHSLKAMAREFSGQLFLFMIFGSDAFIANATHQLTCLSYSRGLEEEADEKGFDIMKQNQVDPQGILDLFKRLKSADESLEIPQFLSTHPLTDERIEAAQELIKNNTYVFKNDSNLVRIFNRI